MPLVDGAKRYLKKEVFHPWKYQRLIDSEASGGMNYKCLDLMRSKVEGLPKNGVGLFPSGSAVALTAKALEAHACSSFGLDIQTTTTS